MKDTQLLLPPLEDNIHESASSFVDGGRSKSQDISNDGNGSRSILPPELRERFETMKSMWRQSRRQSPEGSTNDGTEIEVLKRKQREIAVETAIAVDYEISRLQGGIDELEALLNVEDSYDDDDEVEDSCGEDDEDGIYHDDVVAVVLPSVVPVDDDNDLSNSVGSRESIERDVKEEINDHTEIMGPPATS